jgi:hypothetical protein
MLDDDYEPVPGDRRTTGLGEGTGPEQSFTGNFRLGRPRGGYEYVTGNRGRWARLTLFPKGLRIDAASLTIRTSVPTWEARYDELIDVSSVGLLRFVVYPFYAGVRFYTGPVSNGLMVFYNSLTRGRILTALSARGVSVNRKPIRFGYTRLPER